MTRAPAVGGDRCLQSQQARGDRRRFLNICGRRPMLRAGTQELTSWDTKLQISPKELRTRELNITSLCSGTILLLLLPTTPVNSSTRTSPSITGTTSPDPPLLFSTSPDRHLLSPASPVNNFQTSRYRLSRSSSASLTSLLWTPRSSIPCLSNCVI